MGTDFSSKREENPRDKLTGQAVDHSYKERISVCLMDVARAGGLQRFLHMTSGSLPTKWNAIRRAHTQVSLLQTSDDRFGNVAALGVSGQDRDTEVEENRWNCRQSNDHLKVSFNTPRVLASG